MTRLIALACALGLAAPAEAATSCRVTRTGTLSFGAYDVLLAAPTDSLLTIDVACDRRGGPPSVSIMVKLGPGTHGTGVNARRMLRAGSSADWLHYGLFRDVSRSAVWGETEGVDTGSRTLAIPNNSTATASFPIYGRIPPQQDVPAGFYGDSVQITISP